MARSCIFRLALFCAILLCLSNGYGKTSNDTCEVKGKEVVDKVTGLVFPMHRILPHGGRGRELTLLGVGPRRKNLFVVEVNVYAVGLYLETSLLGRLKAFRGKSSEALAKEAKYYATLMKEGSGLNRALYLIFARTVPAGKIVEALAAVDGVKKEVMADFKKSLLAAIGSSLKEKETLTLAWTPDDRLSLFVRDKPVKTFPSLELARGIFNLYLGEKPISPEAKKGFAAVAPQHIN